MLNCCGFHPDIELRVLINKSLISISNSRIEMHSLLEELGKKIVLRKFKQRAKKVEQGVVKKSILQC